MSAIDFDMDIAQGRPQGRPRQPRHDRQIPAVQILRRDGERVGVWIARLFRASLEFFVTIVSFSARLSNVTPFIAVLIEAATGAEMRPYRLHEMIGKKPRAHEWRG